MKSTITTATLLFFTLGAATAMAGDDHHRDGDRRNVKELVLVLDADLEFRPDREGCVFVIGAPARKANGGKLYDVEFCSRSTVSLPEGCESTTCMDVDEFQIVVRRGRSLMSAEVIDVAGVPDFATLSLIDETIANIADNNPLAAAGWKERGIFTWATMLGTVKRASHGFRDFRGGEAQYEGGLEWVGVLRARGTLRFVAP